VSDHKPVLGLDFGTTNTAAAWWDGRGKLHTVPVRENVFTLPSVVCFHGTGNVLVGDPARQLMGDVPLSTLYGVKRLMGRRFLSDYVGRHRGRFPFKLVEGPGGLAAAEIRGQVVPLDEVAGHVIARIVELANIDAGAELEECVVAVPAHFTHRQRAVIREAVGRAGLRVRAMVNEPTAAALYHARVHGSDAETVLVYDLGGGTFDTTLLRVRRGLAEVLATGGEAFLGGSDFDHRVIDQLMSRFEHDNGIDLRSDLMVQQRLLFAAEVAKIALSDELTTRIRVPCVTVHEDRFIDLDFEMTRDHLERVCAPLIERTIGITLQVIGHAGLQADQIDEVVLVGGQTKMPAIARRLREVLKIKVPPTDGETSFAEKVDADLGVAIGAATFGYGMNVLVDVNAIPVGVMLPGQGPHEAIPQNTALPCVKRMNLTRPTAGSPLPMVVYESVDATSIDRDVLGRLMVDAAWLEANPGDLSLEVRMSADFELAFTVHAKDGGSERLTLIPVGAPADAKPKPEEPVRKETRQQHGVQVALAFPDGLRAERTENLSKGGMFLATKQTAPVGTEVTCTLALGSGPLELRARVVHVLDDETASTIGQPAGMGLTFIDPTPDQQQTILSDIDRGKAGADVEDGALVLESPATELPSKPTDDVLTFIKGAAKQDFYAALGLGPSSSMEEVRAKVHGLRGLLLQALERASEEQAQKLMRVGRVLDRVFHVMCEPRRRLEYDFRQGHALVDDRLERAAGGDGPSTALLREAWRKVHPGPANQAGPLVARALKAAREDDLDAAVQAGEKALELDPFDEEMREKVKAWREGQAQAR
jgi:molecular chaperone DnaK